MPDEAFAGARDVFFNDTETAEKDYLYELYED